MSVLLAKTLRSSTLRLALIWIGIFGTAVAALLGYVYWSSAAYMLRQSDQVLAMDEGIRFLVLAPVVRTRKGEFVRDDPVGDGPSVALSLEDDLPHLPIIPMSPSPIHCQVRRTLP